MKHSQQPWLLFAIWMLPLWFGYSYCACVPTPSRSVVAVVVPQNFAALCRSPTRRDTVTTSTRLRLQLGASKKNTQYTSYSPATMERVQGLSASQEFSKLAIQLQTSEPELQTILTQRLASASMTTNGSIGQKAEYIDWLLSGTTRTTATTGAKKNGKSQSTGTQQQPFGTFNKKTAETPVHVSTAKTTSTRTKSAAASKHKKQQQHQQTFATDVTFAERDDLHPNSKRAVAQMGLIKMTEIQEQTFVPASTGSDVLGRARTGTGKTVAFLLPALERLLQLEGDNNNNNNNNNRSQRIGILVVSPTRELAIQIGEQAEQLIKFHRHMSVQVLYGGTPLKRDITRLTQSLPTVLVATPGRLHDHMQSTRIRGQRFGNDILSQTPIVTLDETDRLLDMGFRREITKILGYLPQPRQTLLFSATIPPDLKTIMAKNMKKDFVTVDCIHDGDAATQTNAQVQQSHVIVPSDRMVSSVIQVVRLALESSDGNDVKIVVFFPTARLVNFFAELFNHGQIVPLPVLELHSKKSQPYRNRVSEKFRNMKRGVLFTSDVSARGVDYPNVSHVIQFGIPESREQYIHRLGRTGRAGTDGKGWLVLSNWESLFLQELKGVDIPVNEELQELVTKPMDPASLEIVEEMRSRIGRGDKVLANSAKGAYQAFLGYYLGQMKRMRMKQKEQLVDIANEFAASTGLREPPALTKQMVGKMGLRGIAGLKVSGGDDPKGGQGKRRSHGHNDGRRAPKKQFGGGGRR